jgi:hypothetical protein
LNKINIDNKGNYLSAILPALQYLVFQYGSFRELTVTPLEEEEWVNLPSCR